MSALCCLIAHPVDDRLHRRAGGEHSTDAECLEGFQLLSRTEGIIPALESSHAVAHGCKLAASGRPDDVVMINLSGRGDKDVWSAARAMGQEIRL